MGVNETGNMWLLEHQSKCSTPLELYLPVKFNGCTDFRVQKMDGI